MDRKKKIGLVVEGGGMKCAYNAGILDAFLDHGISFDYCIGVSGGAGNVASYVAGQRGQESPVFYRPYPFPEVFRHQEPSCDRQSVRPSVYIRRTDKFRRKRSAGLCRHYEKPCRV
ncbi:patatin-like phospholipase family protein [Mediterraneibacter glycyrrhizinilyticus]|uniref:patatin-like phospholipase family protein n=1 Tax=Mediterraneibacter glycyrrhizinilyticus TaxID=342942 RepID=UPI002FE6D4B5